jgi:ferredoxin
MGKYKIAHDIQNCIGCWACVTANGKRWKEGKGKFEGKSELIGGKFDKQNNFFEVEIDEKELEANMEAARTCPVNVIHVIDKKNGKKLI